MAVYFFDTSGLVKRHVEERGTAWVRSLTTPRLGHTIFLARITAVEIFAAISRRQREAKLTPSQAAAILGHVRRHFGQRYNVVELTPSLANDAAILARKHALRAYDAVQLAAAQRVVQLYRDSGLGSVTLISADRDLNDAAIAEGMTVDDPSIH